MSPYSKIGILGYLLDKEISQRKTYANNKISLASFYLPSFVCSSVRHNLTSFSLTSLFVQKENQGDCVDLSMTNFKENFNGKLVKET